MRLEKTIWKEGDLRKRTFFAIFPVIIDYKLFRTRCIRWLEMVTVVEKYVCLADGDGLPFYRWEAICFMDGDKK